MSLRHELFAFGALADDIGAVPAMKLCAFYGGFTVYIPVKFSPDHFLCRLLGEEAFRLLIACHGGEVLNPPAAEMLPLRRAGMVYRLSRYQVPMGVVAGALGLTRNRIHQLNKSIELECIDDLIPEFSALTSPDQPEASGV